MKLKGLTKLALSGVALAAVAATLGTSTYAWYVTNSTAKVTGVQGKVSAGGAGNILVAQADVSSAPDYQNGHGQFLPEIAIESSNLTDTTSATNKGLIPALPVKSDYAVATNRALTAATGTAAAFYTINDVEDYLTENTKWVDSKGELINTSAKTAYMTFKVWVLNTESSSANFEYKITNTTTSSDTLYDQLAYSSTGLPTGVSKGAIFNSNVVNALRIAYTQTNFKSTTTFAYSEVTSTAITAGPVAGQTYYTRTGEGTEQSPYVYSVASLTLVPATDSTAEHYEFTDGTTYFTRSGSSTEFETVTNEDSASYNVAPTASTILDAAANAKLIGANADGIPFTTDGSANSYYNSVMGKDDAIVTSATTISNSNKSQSIILNQNEETLLTFYVWLEGSDEQCFDSVQGQSFSIELTFSK